MIGVSAHITHRGSDGAPANDSKTHHFICQACRAPLTPPARPRHHPITRSSTHDVLEIRAELS